MATAVNLCVAQTRGGKAAALFTIRSDRLGRIRVFTQLDGGGVHAFLGTEREESARLLEQHQDDLKGRLEQTGGQASVEVDLGEEGVMERFRERVAQQKAGYPLSAVDRLQDAAASAGDVIRLQ